MSNNNSIGEWGKLASKSKPFVPTNKPSENSIQQTPTFDMSSINKDNIFQTDVLSKLLPTNTQPVEEKPSIEAPKEQLPGILINQEKTEQLKGFLGTLGIKIGEET